MLKAIKRTILPSGRQPIRVRAGLYRGMRLMLEPQDNAQLLFGLQEAETHPFIRKMLRAAHWMIDVGAAQGELALLFARHAIASVAVDPNDDGTIRRNATVNGIAAEPLLDIRRCFVGTENTVTLDMLAEGRAGHGFVKIDVDGGETDVLRSGDALLAGRCASFLVETHSATLEQECAELLGTAGYAVRIIDNAWWRRFLPELRPIAHNRWLTAEPGSP